MIRVTPQQFQNLTKLRAKGRMPTLPVEMNSTEEAYSQHLELLRRAGKILWFGFEGVKLRLAKKTFLTVDFFVMTDEGYLEAHEVKGWWKEDARVKIKVAAAMYPFRFLGIKKKKDGWLIEEF